MFYINIPLYFLDVKVVCLLQTEHHKHQVVKTLTLGIWPLISVGSNKQVSIKGGITLRFPSLFTLAMYVT